MLYTLEKAKLKAKPRQWVASTHVGEEDEGQRTWTHTAGVTINSPPHSQKQVEESSAVACPGLQGEPEGEMKVGSDSP